MSVVDYSGQWVGEFSGTNSGKSFIEIKQIDNTVFGIARISEPAYGHYEYALQGTISDKIILTLTVKQNPYNIFLGKITVIAELQDDGSLFGNFESTNGAKGVFRAIKAMQQVQVENKSPKNTVFIVHGHDEATKQATARFLENLGINAIILHEQTGKGRTIIEKFEECADKAEFAIILMTPDDYGYPVNDESAKMHRARQNVLVELGYFYAKLGRERTCVLKNGNIEIPSDILSVSYISMGGGEGWKFELAKELKAANFEIDMNKI